MPDCIYSERARHFSLWPAICLLLTCIATQGGATLSAAEPAVEYDILIRGGHLIDGTGAAAAESDLAISGRKITALGDLSQSRGKVEVDAQGLVVAPGFIDLHSHADRGILRHRAAENYLRQGVTTLLCGNCGSSPVDVGKFFAEVRREGTGPNIALLIGHASVRVQVMGRRNAPPDEKQLAEMRRLVRQAMKDGAMGMSTSLRYGAGTYASSDEIVALAKELVPYGGFYATHMRDEGAFILDAMDEALDIGLQAGVPVHISHHKISSTSVFGLTRLTLAKIDKARAAGRQVTLDQYPYSAGSGNVSVYVPQSSLDGGLKAFRKRIADPKQRAEIIAEVEKLLIRKIYEADQRPDNFEHSKAAFRRIQIARAPHDERLEGKHVTQILTDRGQRVTLRNGAELLLELVSENVTGINHTLDDRPGGDVDRVMRYPLTAIGSDGSVFRFGEGNPHPRSYGCFPRVLGHYVRERKLLTLPAAIHRMTQLPAARLKWNTGGVLARGAAADIVLFDPDTIADKATFAKPHQHSVGVKSVIVNGQFALKDGKLTGKLPGEPFPLGRDAPREPSQERKRD